MIFKQRRTPQELAPIACRVLEPFADSLKQGDILLLNTDELGKFVTYSTSNQFLYVDENNNEFLTSIANISRKLEKQDIESKIKSLRRKLAFLVVETSEPPKRKIFQPRTKVAFKGKTS